MKILSLGREFILRVVFMVVYSLEGGLELFFGLLI